MNEFSNQVLGSDCISGKEFADFLEQVDMLEFQESPEKVWNRFANSPESVKAACHASLEIPMDLPYVSFKKSIWGFTLIFNEKATQDIIHGTAAGPLAAAIAKAGPFGPALALALALAFLATSLKAKAVDKGNGVNLFVPWILLPAFAGVAPIVAYILVNLKGN